MAAKEDSERARKEENGEVVVVLVVLDVVVRRRRARQILCARYDSRPLLNAKEPIGSCESDSKRRKWVGESTGAGAFIRVRERGRPISQIELRYKIFERVTIWMEWVCQTDIAV